MTDWIEGRPSYIKDGHQCEPVALDEGGPIKWLKSEIRISPLKPYEYCIEYRVTQKCYYKAIYDRCFGKPVYTKWFESTSYWRRYRERLPSIDPFYIGGDIMKFVSFIEAENYIKEKIEESKKEAAFMSQKPVEFVRS